MPTSTHVFNDDAHTVVLSIELPSAEYMPKVEKKLKEYKNKVQIKGFRQGAVPMNYLKAKFGNSILADEIQGIINDELSTFIDTSKLNMVGSPLPVNKYDASIQSPNDVKLDIEIGFVPEFELKGISKDILLPFYEVTVDDETLDKEIESQRKKLSTEFEETASDIQDGDTIKVSLRESDEGKLTQDGFFKDETFINLDKVSPELKEKILKANVGDKIYNSIGELDTTLSIKRAKKLYFDVSSRQTCSDEVEIEILEIKRVKKRELNSDFYKEVFPNENIEDFETFKAKLRNAISEGFTSAVYNIYNRSIFEHLMSENNQLPLPTEFLRRFVENTQLNGAKVEEKQFEELIKQLTWNTISQELASKYNITVNKEDVEYEMRMAIVRYYGFQISPFHNIFDAQVSKMMEDQETYRKYFDEVLEAKLFAALEPEFGKENKSVNVKDFKVVYDSYFSKERELEDAEAEKLEQVLGDEA